MSENQHLIVPLLELARRYRVPASWLRREVRAGRLPAIKAGSQYLFNAEAIERALAERAASAPREAADGTEK